MQNLIKSRDFWYFVIGAVFIVLLTFFAYKIIIGKSKQQVSKIRESYLEKTSPSPSAKASPTTRQNFQAISLKNLGGQASTKSSEVKVVSQEDGGTYLSTITNSPDSYQASRSASRSISLIGLNFTLPQGFITSFAALIDMILTAAMLFGALATLFHLILGGIYWITSGGDKDKIKKARDRMINAVVGLIILSAAYAIFTLVIGFLGIDSLDELIGSINNNSSTPITATPSAQINPSSNPNANIGKSKGGI